MRFKYIVIVLSIAGTVILYGLSSLSQPSIISLSDIPLNEGKQVMLIGVVTMYQTTTYGALLITIRDENTTNSSTVLLYVEGAVTVEYGDIISATGVVQQYNNNWELSVSNPRFVTVLQHWEDRSFPVWQLATNPSKYVDTNVNVTGIIEAVSKNGFTLQDTQGTFIVPVSWSQSTQLNVQSGALVAVHGRFLYKAETLSYSLQITDLDSGIFVLNEGWHA